MTAVCYLLLIWVNNLFHSGDSSCLLATIQGSSNCPGGSYNLLFNGAFAVSSRKSLPHLRTRVSSPVELRIMGMGSTKFPRGSLVVSELHFSWQVLSWRKISVAYATAALAVLDPLPVIGLCIPTYCHGTCSGFLLEENLSPTHWHRAWP